MNSGEDGVIRQRGECGWDGLVHGMVGMGACGGSGGVVRVEDMRRGSGSPAWSGAEAGAASVQLRGAPPGFGAGWGRAGWHPGLGQGQGG